MTAISPTTRAISTLSTIFPPQELRVLLWQTARCPQAHQARAKFADTTQIPVCLWFVAWDKKNSRFRDRRGKTLFIDAREMGNLVDRVHRELSDEGIDRIAGIYHAWRGEAGAGEYEDVPGFCKSSMTEEIKDHGYVLTPGRYVGAAEAPDDGEPFEEKMAALTTTLYEQFARSDQLEDTIKKNLEALGHGG